MRPLSETVRSYRTSRPRFDGQSATVREFERLSDDGFRYELDDGILRVSPSPSTHHDLIVSFLCGEMYAFLKTRPLGTLFTSEYDVHLAPRRVYKPDVKFVARTNRGIIGKQRIHGPPDLVIEVVSPNDPDRDWRTKFDAYERAGVREYWLIDAESLAATFYLHDGKRFVKQPVRGTRYASTVIDGFRLDLEALASYVRRSGGEKSTSERRGPRT